MTRIERRHDRIQYVTYKGRKYKIDVDHKIIWVLIPSKPASIRSYGIAVERELDWIGPTAFAVRAQLKWEQEQN